MKLSDEIATIVGSVVFQERCKLLNEKGYFARFHALRYEYRSDYLAWEALEKELHEFFGISRYDSYDSFRRMKSYYGK